MSIEQISTHQNIQDYATNRSQIPVNLRDKYECALAQVPRWQKGIVECTVEESDLDHVNSLLGLVTEIEFGYPDLSRAIDGGAVRDILYLHDAGEIIAKDLALSDPNYDNLRNQHKRKEKAGFRYMSREFIEDPILREEARRLYASYEDHPVDNKESLFAHFLDKVQATRFALDHVYVGDYQNNPELQINHEKEAMKYSRIGLDFAVPLFHQIPQMAKVDLSRFILTHAKLYSDKGFENIAVSLQSDWLILTA